MVLILAEKGRVFIFHLTDFAEFSVLEDEFGGQEGIVSSQVIGEFLLGGFAAEASLPVVDEGDRVL